METTLQRYFTTYAELAEAEFKPGVGEDGTTRAQRLALGLSACISECHAKLEEACSAGGDESCGQVLEGFLRVYVSGMDEFQRGMVRMVMRQQLPKITEQLAQKLPDAESLRKQVSAIVEKLQPELEDDARSNAEAYRAEWEAKRPESAAAGGPPPEWCLEPLRVLYHGTPSPQPEVSSGGTPPSTTPAPSFDASPTLEAFTAALSAESAENRAFDRALEFSTNDRIGQTMNKVMPKLMTVIKGEAVKLKALARQDAMAAKLAEEPGGSLAEEMVRKAMKDKLEAERAATGAQEAGAAAGADVGAVADGAGESGDGNGGGSA